MGLFDNKKRIADLKKGIKENPGFIQLYRKVRRTGEKENPIYFNLRFLSFAIRDKCGSVAYMTNGEGVEFALAEFDNLVNLMGQRAIKAQAVNKSNEEIIWDAVINSDSVIYVNMGNGDFSLLGERGTHPFKLMFDKNALNA